MSADSADSAARAAPRPRWDLDDRCRRFPFLAALRERVLVFDGGMGTMIHTANLTLDDYGGKENCIELLNHHRPDVIRDIHAAYFAAGADAVETNTFGSMPVVLAEFGIAERGYELSRKAAEVARQAAADFATAARPRFVSGSVGPTTKSLSLGHIAWADQLASYATQIQGLIDGGVDVVQIETQFDILHLTCAVVAARLAMERAGREVPIIAQVTIETTGTMLIGTEVAAALPVLEALEVDVVGVNCATGPDLMQEHVRFLGRTAARFVSCLPNAGIPRNVGGVATFDLTPEELCRFQESFVTDFGVNLVGGCCGTRPEHIRMLAERVGGRTPRPRPAAQPAQVTSLYSAVTLGQDPAPLIVGERANANGSKKFKELLLREDWDGMVEMAKEAIGEGAHVLDVCTAYVGRPEARDMTQVLRRFSTQVALPLMIDTTQLDVLEGALELVGGRAIINSINLEDGEPKADRICELARMHGAALVALTIDEKGMAKTAEAKLAVARRIYDIAVGRHGLTPESLLFDPLTFTIASGDEDSRQAGVATLDGIEAIKRHLPGVRTLLGLSNISFGLKPFPRQILNSVYLSEAIARGLDAAILNQAKILPLSKLDDDALRVTRDLIYDRRREGYDPLFAFIDRFGQSEAAAAGSAGADDDQPLDERLRRRIIDGKKVGIGLLLDEAMRTWKPLDIINTILLDGMKTVGELFGSGRMQLPFVLQSAETMKTAVAHLEPHMEKVEGGDKGVIVLATVKGDVHDIGKNLVDIILTNNGYSVKNLGIKVPIDQILAEAEAHKADAIGLSGLLVKSTVVMKENLELMASRGLTIPVICGGAALNRAYVESDLQESYSSGEVFYGVDAFTGLALMDELCGHRKERVLTGPGRKRHRRRAQAKPEVSARHSTTDFAASDVKAVAHVPRPPFWGSRVVAQSEIPLAEIFPYINRRALFRGQWQYRRGRRAEEEYRRFIAQTVEPKFHGWCARAIEQQLLAPAVVYGYFPCNADKNDLVVFRPEGHEDAGREWLRIAFPRQTDGRRLCIADFFRPLSSGERDVLGVQVVTMGEVATRHSQELFKADLYDDYLHFHGLAVESAEGLAELWHRRVRIELGLGASDAKNIEGLFAQGYQGSRFSFGYPACPRLEDQQHIFTLLDAGRIGLALTEEFELVPEQSTSAILCHHPEARYFNVT